MKIKINDNEVYEIKLGDYTEHNKEVSAQEFLELLNRFENVVKLIKLNSKEQTLDEIKPMKLPKFAKPKMITTTNKEGRIIRRNNLREWCNTREKAIDVIQYGYHGTKEDKRRIANKIGKKWFDISRQFFSIIQRYNIKPQEVGVDKFGMDKKLIPNYTIKSYTGEYDE